MRMGEALQWRGGRARRGGGKREREHNSAGNVEARNPRKEEQVTEGRIFGE
jgi:hypothetical protein